MKKRFNSNIIIGLILIFVQLMSYYGIYEQGMSILEVTSLNKINSIYGLLYFSGANIYLIIGIILIIIGIVKQK